MRTYEGLWEGGRWEVLVEGEPLLSFRPVYSARNEREQMSLDVLTHHLEHSPLDRTLCLTLESRHGGPIPPREELGLYAPELDSPSPLYLAVRCHIHFSGAFLDGVPHGCSWKLTSEEISKLLERAANHGLPSRFTRKDPL